MLKVEPTRSKRLLTGWRRWLPAYVWRDAKGWRCRIFPRAMMLWTLLLLALGYLSAGTLLYWNDRHRHGLKNISWFDRIYPPHWPAYREARGEAYITQGEAALATGDFAAAFHQVRTGLARSPSHRRGRLLLADMYIAAHRPDLAQAALLDGLAFHGLELDYVKRVLEFLFRRQQDEVVIAITTDLLARQPADSALTPFLALASADAHLHRGQFDQAESSLVRHHLQETFEGRFIAARIEWSRGFYDLALALLEQLALERPAEPSLYRTLIKWQRDQGLADTARRTSLLRQLRYPDQPEPRLHLIESYHALGDVAAVDREISAYLRQFELQGPALLQLGDFAANTGRTDIAAMVMAAAERQNLPLAGPALMLVEAELVAGHYPRAIALARDMLERFPSWQTDLAPIFNGLQAVAHFAEGDREAAALYLDSFLRLKTLRVENLVAVAARLQSVGAHQEARRVLVHAVNQDTRNQAALSRLIEFDLEQPDAAELPAHLEKLLTMRRPSPELLRQAHTRLGGDRFALVPGRIALMDRLAAMLSGRSSPSTVSGPPQG